MYGNVSLTTQSVWHYFNVDQLMYMYPLTCMAESQNETSERNTMYISSKVRACGLR